jgi:hypothetical protein
MHVKFDAEIDHWYAYMLYKLLRVSQRLHNRGGDTKLGGYVQGI